MESHKLEKASKVMESSLRPNTPMSAKPEHWVPALHGCKTPEPPGCERGDRDGLTADPSLRATAASSQPLGLHTTFI